MIGSAKGLLNWQGFKKNGAFWEGPTYNVVEKSAAIYGTLRTVALLSVTRAVFAIDRIRLWETAV